MQKLTAIKARALIHDLSGLRTIREELFRQALEIALPILEQQEKGNDGWIDWDGGECPVIPGSRVDLKLRGGVITPDFPAETGDWGDHGCTWDIIAYRVIENDGREG